MEKQDYKAIRAALFMSYAIPTALRLLDLIDKPVQTTKEQPNNTQCKAKGGTCFCSTPEMAICKG